MCKGSRNVLKLVYVIAYLIPFVVEFDYLIHEKNLQACFSGHFDTLVLIAFYFVSFAVFCLFVGFTFQWKWVGSSNDIYALDK